MDRPSHTTDVISATRRTVIRASFGVPALATVASGSALAATSATCFAKQLTTPVYPLPTTSANPDTYLRVQLGKFVANGAGGAVTYYVDGSNLNAALGTKLQRSAGYLMGNGNFQTFDVGTNTETGPIVSATPSNGTYTRSGGTYVVLRFDSTGKVVGVGRGGAGTTAVGASCWSSFSP